MADKNQGNDAMAGDPAIQGRAAAARNPGGADRLEDVGSAEAKTARGIDAHTPNPGASDRQEVHAPTEKLDQVSSYTGSLSNDRESRQNPDAARGMQRGGNAGPNETSGSNARMTGPTGGQLESDEGVAEQEKDPIE